MNYREAVKRFHEENPEYCKGSGIDYWAAQYAWSVWLDGLCKSGEVTLKQWNNWATPFKYGKRL